MRTTTKFRLDDPTRIKWDQYIALIPQIDEIMRDNEIELLTRCTEENDYSVEEVFDYKNEHQFTALVVTLNQLVNKANLFFTLLKRADEPNPQGYRTTMNVRLRPGYRSRKYWEKWLAKSEAVKEAMLFNGVHMRRELDLANYSVRTTAYYRRPADFAAAFFTAGWMYGRANIPLETTDIFEETYQLDLLEDMKDIIVNQKTY